LRRLFRQSLGGVRPARAPAGDHVAILSILSTHTHDNEVMSLRLIYLHMIEEYARHLGHADFLRERIDGATGE
jgi:hypothetical protein